MLTGFGYSRGFTPVKENDDCVVSIAYEPHENITTTDKWNYFFLVKALKIGVVIGTRR